MMKLSEVEWDIDQHPDLLARIDMEEEEEEEDQEEDEDEEDEEEKCEITDNEEDPVAIDVCAFDTLVEGSRVGGVFDHTHFNYQRGPEATLRTYQRRVKAARELRHDAKGSYKLEAFFSRLAPKDRGVNSITQSQTVALLTAEECTQFERRQEALTILQKKLAKKKHGLNPQNLMRHEAVLGFLKIQQAKSDGETREEMARIVARVFGKGPYFARRLITWEVEWMNDYAIPEGSRGCYAKTQSWFKDEGVQTAVREWIASHPSDRKS